MDFNGVGFSDPSKYEVFQKKDSSSEIKSDGRHGEASDQVDQSRKAARAQKVPGTTNTSEFDPSQGAAKRGQSDLARAHLHQLASQNLRQDGPAINENEAAALGQDTEGRKTVEIEKTNDGSTIKSGGGLEF